MKRGINLIFLSSLLLLLCACTTAQTVDGTAVSGVVVSSDPTEVLEGSSYATTLFGRCGMEAAIEGKYLDALTIFDGESAGAGCIVRVYEKRSYDEAMQDFGAGAGFLFSIERLSQAELEHHICNSIDGLAVFARDDEFYYARGFATDVQLYRSNGKMESAVWTELQSLGEEVTADFITRNDLVPYTLDSFYEQETTYDGAHLCYAYYEVPIDAEPTLTLLLSQPVRQGEGGIWCVERVYDPYYDLTYYYFPACRDVSVGSAEEFYAAAQAQCDAGERFDLLEPVDVCIDFVETYVGRTVGAGNFVLQ